MKFEDAVSQLEKRLGQRQDLNADIRIEMQNAQDFILETDYLKLQFQLHERQTTDTTIGDDRVELPDDFLAEYEETALFLIQESGAVKPLIKETLGCLTNKYGDSQAEPVFYARTGNYFRLYPIPDDNYTIRMLFYVKGATLTDGAENHWLANASDWLIAQTGIVMALQYMQNTKMAEGFAAQAKAAHDRLWRAHEASLSVNRDMIKGV